MKYLKLFEQSSEFATADDYKSLLKICSTICNVENGEYEGIVDRMMDKNHITNSYIEMIATESGGSMVIMDYEIEDFIKTLQDAVKEPGEEIE